MALGWYVGGLRKEGWFKHNEKAIGSPDQKATQETRAAVESVRVSLDELARRFPDDHQSTEVCVALFAKAQELKSNEFPSVIAALLSEGWKGRETAELLAGYWAERDLPAAREWMLGMKDQKSNVAEAIFDTWAQSDFPSMAQWLDSESAGLSEAIKRAAGFSIARMAGKPDAERALELESKLAVEGSGYRSSLYMFWAARDPAAAAARVMQEVDKPDRTNFISSVIGSWAALDPEAAQVWVKTLPDPILVQNGLAQIGNVIGWRDPGKGAAFLASLPQSDQARSALKQTLNAWKTYDLAASLEWSAQLGQSSLASWTFEQIARDSSPEKLEMAIGSLELEDRRILQEKWKELRASGTQNPNPRPGSR